MSSKAVRIGEMFTKLHIGHFKKSYTSEDSTVTYTLSGQVVTRPRLTEKQAFLSASGKEPLEPNPPVLDTPNIYTNLKRCAYPDHDGDRWVNRSKFNADKHHSDGLHSYCKACEAKRKKFAYIPKWRRGI